MDFIKAINHFYFETSIQELRLMHQERILPGISYNSLLYLDVISYKPNCTISTLADLLGLTKSAITLKVNELVKQGFLTKSQSQSDKRVYYLSLSKEAKEVYEHYDYMLDKAYRLVRQNYSEEDIRKFSEMLNLVSGIYEENL